MDFISLTYKVSKKNGEIQLLGINFFCKIILYQLSLRKYKILTQWIYSDETEE